MQGLSEMVRKISPLPGFDLGTVHPVASRYTATLYNMTLRSWELHIKV
jgi:hypothetical protein